MASYNAGRLFETSLWCHQVWINGHVIRFTPGSIDLKNSNKNEIVRMGNDSFITVSNRDDAFEYSFEFKVPIFRLPETILPWEIVDPEESEPTYSHNWWKDYFWNLKNNDNMRFEPIEFVIERTDGQHTVEKMLLKDYSCVEDAEDDSAFTFSVTLMEYRMCNNQELDTDLEHHLIQSRQARGWKAGRGRMGLTPKQIRLQREAEHKAELGAAVDEFTGLTMDQENLAFQLDKLAKDEYAQMVAEGKIPEWYQKIGANVPRREHATDPFPIPLEPGSVI